MSTLKRLQEKAESSMFSKGVRMPSLVNISKMLAEFNIKHSLRDSHNVVERRTAGKRYVNSRHNGKEGKELFIEEANIRMDSSDSYYSWNTRYYAGEIINFLEKKNKIVKK